MTPIADMVEQMLARDTPAADIVAAIRAVEVVLHMSRDMSRDLSRDMRRTEERDRKRKYRERLANGKQTMPAASPNCPGTCPELSRDMSHVSTDSIDSGILPFEKEEKKERKKEVVTPARGTRLAAGSPLLPAYIEAAVMLGARRDQVSLMWDEFVDYWAAVPGSRGTKLDWLMTWRNRIREKVSKGNQNGKTPNGGGSILAAFDEVIAGTAQPDRGAREETVLMLPFGPSRGP